MTAQFWVLVADDLYDTQPDWPTAGLHLIERGPVPDPPGYSHWCLFKDDNAPPELDGHRVDLQISRIDGQPVVTRRDVLP